jgi:hypothetical protein
MYTMPIKKLINVPTKSEILGVARSDKIIAESEIGIRKTREWGINNIRRDVKTIRKITE